MFSRARSSLASSVFVLFVACADDAASEDRADAPQATVTVTNRDARVSLAGIRFREQAGPKDAWSDNPLLATGWLKPGASVDVKASCNINLLVFVAFSDSTTSEPAAPLKFPCSANSKLDVQK
jgi:hypothetical protein